MAMDYLSALTTLFGSSAVLTGTGAEATITFKPSELGVSGNFTAPEAARPEAFVLALLQKANAAQGVTVARAMEITKTTVLATKDAQPVNGEQYIVRIFSSASLVNIDPDTV
jgi:hypothetical protein